MWFAHGFMAKDLMEWRRHTEEVEGSGGRILIFLDAVWNFACLQVHFVSLCMLAEVWLCFKLEFKVLWRLLSLT
jgi:hypothetical protein